MRNIKDKLIEIVKEDSTEALGCTEPVSVGYAANVAGSYVNKDKVKSISLITSKNIFKNGKSVKIPKTGSMGLELACALGFLTDTTNEALLVFSDIDDKILNKAKDLISQGKISVQYKDGTPDIYVCVKVETDKDTCEVLILNSHTHIAKIVKNEEVIKEDNESESKKDKFSIKDLSFEQLKNLVEDMDFEELSFTLEGVEVNMDAAQEGLKGYGSNLGKTLLELRERGVLEDNFITNTRILTAAAADMRMGGGNCPIMTSGGSGNQGIGVIIPIYMTAGKENVGEERLARALFFAHVINRYVKEYSGKLSGLCGCAIGSAVGASAGIVYMLGGSSDQIAGACTNIYANITGMICDGAKESCSMKLASSAEEAIIAAYLSLSGVISEKNVGIIGDSIEDTISNIGRLSHEAFEEVDNVVLEIIQEDK